jgi:thymidylate synthase (FAD)
MKALYENHYLTDRDVANFARQSFATLADNFTEAQNNKLIQFLARGMASGDWETLIKKISREPEYGVRMSMQEASELATYLRKIPEHWVPFGHPHISIRVQAPIPIRVQAFKHKIGFVESEESRRYISTTPELYMPDAFRSAAASVKQGSAGDHHNSTAWLVTYENTCHTALSLYNDMIKDGVCAEQARFILPQGCEVNWLWTGSLYAYANFYNQRSDPHAQKEIQELAEQINKIITPLYPTSWPALTQGVY